MDNYQIGMKALNRLKKVIKDFPFASDVDRSVVLAAMVLAVQRPTLPTAPIIAFTATTPASGKTLLMTGIASLTNGLSPAVHGFKPNEDEFSKVLMSVMMQCEPYLLIDNVKLGVVLESEGLCTISTSGKFAGRVLGFSKWLTVSTQLLIFVTGNNLRIGNDLTRRTLMCRLDPKTERPELREFERNFLEICMTDREAIVTDVLSILSAYHAAGRPEVNNVRLGSFETFCDDICKPLVWLGEPDPVLGLAKADADAGVGGLSELMVLWNDEIKHETMTAAALIDSKCCPNVLAFFQAEFGENVGMYGKTTINARKVGNYLSKYAGRVIDGRCLTVAGTSHKAKLWQLQLV